MFGLLVLVKLIYLSEVVVELCVVFNKCDHMYDRKIRQALSHLAAKSNGLIKYYAFFYHRTSRRRNLRKRVNTKKKKKKKLRTGHLVLPPLTKHSGSTPRRTSPRSSPPDRPPDPPHTCATRPPAGV